MKRFGKAVTTLYKKIILITYVYYYYNNIINVSIMTLQVSLYKDKKLLVIPLYDSYRGWSYTWGHSYLRNMLCCYILFLLFLNLLLLYSSIYQRYIILLHVFIWIILWWNLQHLLSYCILLQLPKHRCILRRLMQSSCKLLYLLNI